jgi:hypothetical protein
MLFEFSFVEFLDNGLELFCNMQEPLDNVLGLIFISNVVLKYTKTQFFFQGRLLKLWIGWKKLIKLTQKCKHVGFLFES